MDREIKRKPSSRTAPRGGAIAYGIEGSKVVLASLERTKVEDDIAFLQPVADNATALLCTMREIREGEVDDEFACLALDACGLAFILINECYRCRRDHNQIPDNMKWGSKELAEYLQDDVHSFVQKKIGRGFLKRRLMHATDDEKIMKFREKLRTWMGKLGIQTDVSIHEMVETIISERMLIQNEEVQECVVNVVQSNSTEALQNQNLMSNLEKEKPLPQIIVSNSRDEEGFKGSTGKLDGHTSADEDRDRKMKKEEERLARKAERQIWRRSEQEFSLLPLKQETTTPAGPEGQSRPASVSSFCSQANSFESVQSSVSGLKHDEDRDRELALQLQAELAKEIEEEDEKKALEIGIVLHQQWVAEEQEKSNGRHLGSPGVTVQLRTPDSMDSHSLLKPETRHLPKKHPLPGGKTFDVPDENRSASPIHQPRAHKGN